MLKNHFKVAYRNLIRDKVFSLLNILGLTVGIASFLLIALFVKNELSFDQFHEKGDRIYSFVTEYYSPEGGSSGDSFSVLGGIEFRKRIPEIEELVQLSGYGEELISVDEQSFYEDKIYYTNESLFKVFDFPVIKGVVDLSSPNKAVITESIAIKYFGDADPIGKTFSFNKDYQYEVAAVAEDPPANSYIQFKILLSEYRLIKEIIPSREHIQNRWGRIAYTYFLLSNGAEKQGVLDQMLEMAETHFPKEIYRNDDGKLLFTPKMMAYEDIHLKSGFTSGLNKTGDMRYVYLFSAIAALILLIACVNYVNLSTAKSVKRAKETGLRKVIGASRSHLIKLYLTESLALTTIAVLLAFALAERVLPFYNNLIERELVLEYWGVEFFLTIVVINLVVSFLAGAYPAFKLSSFGPIEAIRSSRNPKGRALVRKSLVLVQFLIAQLLIITTIIIQSQLSYLQNKDLGYNREHSLYIDTHNELDDNIEVFRDAVSRIPSVSSVALSDGIFTWGTIAFFQLKDIEGNEDDPNGEDYVFADVFGVDHDFVDLMQIQILEGRNFEVGNSNDEREAILINQAAAEEFGWDDPIGKSLKRRGRNKYVIGVMKNFHNESLRAEIKPVFIELAPKADAFVNARILPEDIPGTLKQLEAEWDKLVPDRPFEYTFYDDKFDQHYRSEQRLGQIFIVFASLAISISLLGLIGLTAFSAEQRLKEIGIRKVLGATIKQLLFILSKEFLTLIVIAFVIAVPITYYVMEDWLSVFKYRIEIGAVIYLITILASVAVAWFSASFLSLKVARRNPAEILRTE